MTAATQSTTQTYKLLSQGHTKPFTDACFLFGHLVKLAQPVMTDYQSDLFHDATWLHEHTHVQPNDVFIYFWNVSTSHTWIGTESGNYNAYGTKQQYRFTLFLGSDGWWTLNIEHLNA